MYLPGEHVYQVSGMSCPATHMEPRAERRDAVRLFLQAARRIHPSFELSEATKPHLVRIVKLVGGLPLAIEAVASWVRVLPLHTLADELEANGSLLRARETGDDERHVCMHTVLEHSIRRLPPRQAQILADLAALDGAFDRDAAAKVAGAELVDLWLLLDLCFLTWDGARFTMLDLVRRRVMEPQVSSDA
jgi:predicted ATPase